MLTLETIKRIIDDIKADDEWVQEATKQNPNEAGYERKRNKRHKRTNRQRIRKTTKVRE